MVQVSESDGLTIGQVTKEVSRAIIENGWLDDETENRQQGYGKGFEGRVHAREGLLSLLEREDHEADFGLLGVFFEGQPIGFMAVDLVMDHKIADLYLFIAKEFRSKGYGTAVISFMLDKLFESGIYRVQVDILRINKNGLQFLRDKGFTWEATKKSAYWMDNNVFDVAHCRILRPQWQNRSEE